MGDTIPLSECQGRFSFNLSVFFVSFVGNNERDIVARDPAKDLSSEEVKRVKLCSVNDGMVDAADTKNIMVKMDMVL